MCERAVIKNPYTVLDNKIPEEFKTRELYFRLIRKNVRFAFFSDALRLFKEDPEFVEMVRCKGGNGDCMIWSGSGNDADCGLIVISSENCHKVICSKHHRMYDNPNIPYDPNIPFDDWVIMEIPRDVTVYDDRGMRKI